MSPLNFALSEYVMAKIRRAGPIERQRLIESCVDIFRDYLTFEVSKK